ncbi:CRISPR-associated endoribonuclease Cas2 [Porphyromonas cangingivalis]|uniref:CRISPR-associated endoribonuclease Cas2 n=2 Tax=Porphyromonas cangingivalis TaxID=36874 RepID=A0A1T4JLP0_PORCN|nr:CRISPR-associated protein Cas2 [Porphyromonas cangingivalis]VEJ04327.1 CRISPR-associated endoribonuclease Cas2 [Porphyromonas cangingivalis]
MYEIFALKKRIKSSFTPLNGSFMPSKILIAYDISSNRCRQKVAKILENYGIRVNKSVFMCTIKTESQLNALLHSFQPIISRKDSLFVLPLCRRCYANAWFEEKKYTPESRRKRRTKII